MTDTMTTQSMPSDDDPAARAAAEVFGIPYPFPWQRLIIAAVLDAAAPLSCGRERGGGSVSGGSSELYPQAQAGRQALRRIAVLPTGAGKSLCWMLPAVLIDGITVAVFPLLALMSDQQRRLREAGVPTVMLRGGQTVSERAAVWRALENGDAKIVLANPEVLYAGGAARRLGALKPRFLVVDETHTVSQWGESFRPACAEMGRLVEAWNPPAVLALTATAGPRIRERISALLFNGESPSEALANPDRPAVRYGVLPSLSPMHTLERLVRDEARPAVVFGPTRSSVQRAARTLRGRLNDDNIRFYHAGLNRDEKQRLEEWFFSSRNGVLCATCAYGLGVDKPDIRTVIHLAPPSSVEAYLQESGRASRDGKGAAAWLIWQPHEAVNVLGDSAPAPGGDRGCALSGQAAPEGDSAGPEADTEGRSAGLGRAAGAPKAALEAHSGGPRRTAGAPRAALEAHSGGPRQAAANHPKPDNQGRRFSSGSQITPKNYPAKTGRPALDSPSDNPAPDSPAEDSPLDSPEALARARRIAMIRYAASTGRCRREMLLEALGIEAEDCGGCDVCGGQPWEEPPEAAVILGVLRRNRRRFGEGNLARILIGRRSAKIRRRGLELSPGFGALSGWELEDAEEALAALIRGGRIAYRGFGRHRALDLPRGSGRRKDR